MVHICGICAHPRSFFNKNVLRSFCWWSSFSKHVYYHHKNARCWKAFFVNMFIIITKMCHKEYELRLKDDIVSIVCWCCRSTVPPPTSAFTVYKTQILRRNICPSLKSASVSTHRMKNQSILISLLPHVSALSNIILYLLYIIII